jgi:hypothetical protein
MPFLSMTREKPDVGTFFYFFLIEAVAETIAYPILL